MKKFCTLLMATVAMSFGFNNTASAQVEQGSIIIDPYYGYPNFGKSFADLVAGDSSSNVNITGIGPCGLRAEYLVADNFGVGFDFIYNSVGVEYDYNSWDTNGFQQTYTDKVNQQRFRIQLRINYHFVQTDVLDAYVGFGAGSNTRRVTYTSTDPTFTEPDAISGAFIPVSVRIALGARYYFIPNLGLNMELGIGGPVISGGLSLKF